MWMDMLDRQLVERLVRNEQKLVRGSTPWSEDHLKLHH